jgi:uncharacterized protein (DUF2141 family)
MTSPMQLNHRANAAARLAFGAALALALAPAWAAAQVGASATLEVVVPQLRNAQGALGCQLFASEQGFPKAGERAQQSVIAPIRNGAAVCRFQPVPAGAYAVSVMHDENGNQRLDSNLVGMPTEGYGASNNKTHAMSAPRWDESRFELAAGENRQLTIHLRY